MAANISKAAKAELAEIYPSSRTDALAELSALMHTAGSLRIGKDKDEAFLATDNPALPRLASALALTLLLQVFLAEALPGLLARGSAQVFEDYESFVAYMETPSGGPGTVEVLEDSNGFAVCTYTRLNGSVMSIGYTPRDGSVLPIRVITYDAVDAANALAYLLAELCFALYPLELLAAALLYRKKLRRV